jgi:hypothetical protein
LLEKLNTKNTEMKNLKETIEAKTKGSDWTNELIAKEIGMSRVGFYQALEKNSLKLDKLLRLLRLFNIEPNDLFNWNVEKSNNAISEPKHEYGPIKKDTEGVSVGEVESLTSAINNLTAK